ncbi:unnamed protein product [Durusdinium trenchii]|uniref:Importin N-terminal domain-containing protein n=1 Tax=Durusdinium trenchii TaxID=1381693 RepID=A0ABP0L537_9DINO
MQAIDPEVLYQVFRHSYSPHGQERRQAEAFLQQAAFRPGLLPALLHVTNAAQEVPIRQAAAIQLKNQLRLWDAAGDSGSYSEEDKAPIRRELVESLAAAVGEKGVRVQLVECFRLVALYDFPDRWPGIVQRLLGGLCSEQRAQTMCSLLLFRQLFKLLETRSAERRGELQALAAQCMPTLLQLSPVLAKAASAKSQEAFEMLKLVLKCFYSATRMALPEQVQKDIQHWMELLLTVSEWQLETPATGLEREVQEASCEVKCRKWVFQILLRFYQKHCHMRRVAEGMEAFAKAWNDAYEVPVARVCLKEACAGPQGTWAPKRSLSLALLCLAEACRREAAFQALKPNLQLLLEHGIFPQVRFGEAELQLWQEDPEELLRELTSACDSDSEPHQAAIELVERLLLYHHKEILLPLLHFCRQHLETEANDPAACSNQDGALVLLGLMVEYLVELDPTQMEEVEARRKRKGTQRKAQQSVSVEELISRYVRPAMTSPAAFLRLRGAWCLGNFAQKAPKLGRPGVAAGACCDCLRMLADQELPVRVLAASCLESLLQREDDEVSSAVGMQLAPAMESLLRTLGEVQSEEVGSALQRLVEAFPYEVVPFAAQLVSGLARQFCLSSSKDEEDDDADESEMSSAGALATIISVLQACSGLQRPEDPREQERRSTLFANLAEPLMPVVAKTLRPDGIDFLEEGLYMVTYLTAFCALPMPANLWGPFPRLFQAICGRSTASLQLPEPLENGWAPDHMGSILDPLLNYIARGPVDVILSGSWTEGNMSYAEMVFCMVKKVLQVGGLGAEQDAAAAVELGSAIFIYAAPPAADNWLAPYLCEFWTRLSGEIGTTELRRALLVAFATLLWYNPERFLQCTEETGFSAQIFEAWLQKISVVQRLRHRKVTLLALLQLFRLGCAQALPSSVAQGLPHLLRALAMQSKEIIRLRQKGSNNDDESEHSQSEDEDVKGAAVEEILQKLQKLPDNVDDDNSEAESELEGMEPDGKIIDFQAQRPSRLDGIEELAVLRQMLREAPAPMQQQVNTWVGGSLHHWLSELDALGIA